MRSRLRLLLVRSACSLPLLMAAPSGIGVAFEPATFPLIQPRKEYSRAYPEPPVWWERRVQEQYREKCLAADRPLAGEELGYLLQLGDFLLDKRRAAPELRERAANNLGRIGHQHAMPALLAAMRDEIEQKRVRLAALRALSTIRDKRVVDPLIEALLDEDYGVASAAQCELYRITGRDPKSLRPLVQDASDIKRDLTWDDWQGWWETHRDHVQLRSRRTHAGMGGMGGACSGPFGGFFENENEELDCEEEQEHGGAHDSKE